MKHIIIFLALISLTSCDAINGWLDYINADPIEEVQDTCTQPVLYTEPAFVCGMMIIDETVTTDVVIHVGQFTDTIQPGEDMSEKLKNLLTLYDPAYSYQVWASDADWRRIAFIAKGTNDRNHYHGKVYLKFNQYQTGWGFQCATQYFNFGGALNYEEYLQAIEDYPSYDYINWLGTNWDSLKYETAARKAEYCQIGRSYVNFRFNKDVNGIPLPISQEVVDLYINAGWDSVLH